MTGHKTGETVTVDFTTASPTTGAAADADALPTGTLVLNGTDDAAVVTVTNKATGVYKAAVTLPTVTDGDELQVRIAATVGGVAGKGVIWRGAGISERASDTYSRIGAAGAGLTAIGDARLANLDAAITSRYEASQATADVTDILANIASVPGLVWAAGTRTLTGFGTLVADVWAAATRSLTDKAGFTLSAAEHQTLARLLWPNGNVYFVTTTGTSGNSGLSPASPKSLTSALATAVEGDLILVGPGTYSGTFTPTNTGVTVRGCGPSTILTHTTSGANFGMLSRTTLEDVQLLCGSGGLTSNPGIWGGGSTDVTDCIIRRVTFRGLFADAIFSTIRALKLKAYDCDFNGVNVVLDNGGGGGANNEYYLIRCTGRSVDDPIRVNGVGPVFLIDCDFEATSTGHGIDMAVAATVVVSGGSIRTRDATGFDIRTLVGAAGGKIQLAGVKYRRDSIDDAGGAVEYLSSRDALLTTERVKLDATQSDYTPATATELAKVPKVGETKRHRNVSTNATADVAIEEAA